MSNYKICRFIPHQIKDLEGDFSAGKLKVSGPPDTVNIRMTFAISDLC